MCVETSNSNGPNMQGVVNGLEPRLHGTERCDSRNFPTLSSRDILLVYTTWLGPNSKRIRRRDSRWNYWAQESNTTAAEREVKIIASMAHAAADIDVAAAGMHLQAAASGGDIFKVCLNKDILGHLLQWPAELEALQREFADWSPGPVLLDPGTAVELRPTVPCPECRRGMGPPSPILPLPCQYCLRGMKGIVTEHRATDPRLVTVSLQMAVDDDIDTEEQTKLVLYSVLRDSGLKALRQERARIMQEQIEGLLSPTPGTGTYTVIGYNEFLCGGNVEREYWLCLDEGPLAIKANQMPMHAQNNPDKKTLCVLHVRYSDYECLQMERAALRVTESIELRAHQDKCRSCNICTARRKCSKCKGQIDHKHHVCVVKLDCVYCTEFKWQGGYGNQLVGDQCSTVEPICTHASMCTEEFSLDDACQRRFALVVGNGEYGGSPSSSFEKLGGAMKDALAVSDRLQRLGFKVHNSKPLLNQNKNELEREVQEWTRRLPENSVALVFLSGHGMELQGERYFVSVDYQMHEVQTIVAMAKEKCVTLEWIHDRVYSALRQDGLILSFWDCCRENALKVAETWHIVRGAGGDSLIRNMDKLKKKLAQTDYDSADDKTASWVTVYASSPASLAFGDDPTGGFLTRALLAWWQHDEYAACSIGDTEVQDFVDKHLKDSGVKQKSAWESVGGGRNFRFKEENHSHFALAALADAVVDASHAHVSFGSSVPITLTGQAKSCTHQHIRPSVGDSLSAGAGGGSQARRAVTEWPTDCHLPTPTPAPWPFNILFVGVNSSEKAYLNLKEEFQKMESAWEKAFNSRTYHRKPLNLIPYSTWKEVMHAVRRDNPTILHFGCHAQASGLELFEQTVQPQKMIQSIEAHNEFAREKRRGEIRVVVINA